MSRRRLVASMAILCLGSAASAGPDTSGGIAWEKSVASAKERAKKEKKAVVVDFWASWCGWCRVQDKEVFGKPKMVEFSKGQVYLKLNTEDGGDGTKLAASFGVASLPTILVMDADGKEIDRIAGYVPLDAFIDRLKQVLEGKGEFQQLTKKPDPSGEELMTLGRLYLERNDVDGAKGAFSRLLTTDPANKGGFTDEALYILAQIALATGKGDEARRLFEDYLKRYPNEQAAPRVRSMLDSMPKMAPGSSDLDVPLLHRLQLLEAELGQAMAEAQRGEKLQKLARYDDVPGIDLSIFPEDRRAAVLDRLNSDLCTCGCEDDTVAQCCHVDPDCKVAPRLARAIVDEAAASLRASR